MRHISLLMVFMLLMVGTKCLVGKSKSSHWLCTTVARARSKKKSSRLCGAKRTLTGYDGYKSPQLGSA